MRYTISRGTFMSFRTRRVLISIPFYMIFLFFLLKYIFLLIGDVNEAYLIILAILIGSFHLFPMFFEAKKSTVFWRNVSKIDGVCMWASLMFVMDLAIIYFLRMFIHIPDILIYLLLALVPVLGVYNFYKAHKLTVN